MLATKPEAEFDPQNSLGGKRDLVLTAVNCRFHAVKHKTERRQSHRGPQHRDGLPGTALEPRLESKSHSENGAHMPTKLLSDTRARHLAEWKS